MRTRTSPTWRKPRSSNSHKRTSAIPRLHIPGFEAHLAQMRGDFEGALAGYRKASSAGF